MEIKKELLELKNLNMEQKIVLSLIENDYVVVVKPHCSLTATEMGKMIGLSRKRVKDLIWELDELGLITSEVNGEYRERITKVTNRYKKLIKVGDDNKELIKG